MALHPQNQPVFATANQSAVAKSLSGVRTFARQGRWLGKGNRYAADTIEAIKQDLAAGTINGRHLAQYIAVSSLLHATDGWSYLGRSLQALLGGDPHRALHLAYYAELRGAMSLLACVGIGVFKNRHFVVSGQNSVTVLPIGSPTHDFVWDALTHWAGLTTSGAVFAKVVRPYGRPLEDWLAPVGGGAAVLPQAQEWFKQWGMDLNALGDDRESRNSRSYRPTGIPQPWPLVASEAAKFVSETWDLLEPAASSFEQIDRHILRLSLERLFAGRTGATASAAQPQFVSMIDQVVRDQGLVGAVGSSWRSFLLRTVSANNPWPISQSGVMPVDGAADAYGVASRATLLLRMATGQTHLLFEEASVPADAIDFWRDDLGLSRGLWLDGGRPDLLTDLWSDITATASDVSLFLALGAADDRSFRSLSSYLSQSLSTLGGCERVPLWSVLPSE